MASSFMGLYVQRDGLNLAQKGLDITGNNLANVKTEGYTRQRLDLVSAKISSSTLGYDNSIFLAGAGVEGQGVTQTRDALLDDKYRKYSTVLGDLEVKSNVLSDVEDAIDDIENDEAGFARALSEFKAAWQSFSSSGTDQDDLANVAKNAAQNAINVIKNFSSRMDSISDDTYSDVETTVTRINTILETCAKLNEQIKASYVQLNDVYDKGYGFEADINYGPLELKDTMNYLIDELSTYTDISAVTEADGTFTIQICGVDAVKNDEYAKMTISEDTTPTNLGLSITDLKTNAAWRNIRCECDGADADLVAEINHAIDEGNFTLAKNLEDKLVEGGVPADYQRLFPTTEITGMMTGGTLKGGLDMYNGKGMYADAGKNAYNGIQYYKATMDALATSIAEEFNAIYDGYDFKMFDFRPGYENTAAGLIIADEWQENPLQAVHPAGIDEEDYNYDELTNVHINKILSVFEATHLVGKETVPYTFEDFVAHYGNTIGSQLEGVNKSSESSEIMFNSVSDARDSIMGVSTDEEGVNMLTYQKWYNAMSRMVNALDELLDRLINSTGRVGL
ncbi:MAG: hypothetical protein IJ446_03225 [Oscillospiraceae bacterium]|nr:hypothetical protein [Oscillospiraceae bacterium]